MLAILIWLVALELIHQVQNPVHCWMMHTIDSSEAGYWYQQVPTGSVA